MFSKIQSFLKKHKVVIAIFLIAFIAHSALFFINFSNNNYDLIPTIKGDDGYFELSKSLVDGNGFTWDVEPPFNPNPLRPPIYPFFIAGILLLFRSYWAVLLAQLLISSLIPVLGMKIVNKVIPSNKISISVGVLLALEPFSALLGTIFYTETLFIFLFFVFLLFFFNYFKDPSYRNIVWSALFLGLATLTKPTVQYLPVIIPFFILWHFRKSISKRVIMQIIVFLLLFILTISSWLYRNYKEFGVVGISAQPAFNLQVYLVPTVLSIDNKTSFSIELNKLREDGLDENDITLATSNYYTKQALSVIKEHKVALLKSVSNTALAFFTHDGMLTVLGYAGYRPSTNIDKPALSILFNSPKQFWSLFNETISSPMVLILIGRMIWVIMTLAFIYGTIRLFLERRFNTILVFVLFLIAYFAGTTAINGLGVNARFRMPVNLFILMVAIYGIFDIQKKMKALKALIYRRKLQ